MAEVFDSFEILSRFLKRDEPTPKTIPTRSIVALGNYDGLHRGHQQLLLTCRDIAKRKHFTSIAFTFDPHPSQILRPMESRPALLLTSDEKIELLKRSGVDKILNQRFDSDFSKLTAEGFAIEVLKNSLEVDTVVVGANFRFGLGAQGSPQLLRDVGERVGFEVEEIRLVDSLNHGHISSSQIRKAIAEGDVAAAQASLGYPFFVSGRVAKGAARGRLLGFPTANLEMPKKALPAAGVYATLTLDLETQNLFSSVTNVGHAPTFNPETATPKIESYLLNFSDDLYGRRMRVFFLDRIRDEQKFDSLEDLTRQIKRDVTRASEKIAEQQVFHSEKTDPNAVSRYSLNTAPKRLSGFKIYPF